MSVKKVLITGGTGGIGCFITKALLDDGHELIVWARDLKKFEDFSCDISQNSKNISFKNVDVSNESEVKAAAKEVGDINVLINAAAVLWPVKPFAETDMKELRKSIEISMWGTIYCCYYLLPLLKASKGEIINFSGGGGANGRINHTAYSIAKTGVIRFTENLALENPEIRVNVIAPGAHKTSIWNDEKSEKEPDKWGDMEHLVDFFRFLVSDKFNGVTGKFINYKDDWNDPAFIEKAKNDPDFLTLRRIDDFCFTKIKK